MSIEKYENPHFIDSLEIGTSFYACPQFDITFKYGHLQFLGVARFGPIITKIVKSEQTLFNLADENGNSFDDSSILHRIYHKDSLAREYHVALTERELVKKWMVQVHKVLKGLNTLLHDPELLKEKNQYITDMINNSRIINKIKDEFPEDWI